MAKSHRRCAKELNDHFFVSFFFSVLALVCHRVVSD